MNYGPGFARAREAAGLTQKSAAEALGSNRSYLAALEVGDRDPSMSLLKRMAEVYGCEMADLFPRTKDVRTQELHPLMAELYGMPAEQRDMMIQQFANLARAFAISLNTVTQRPSAPNHAPTPRPEHSERTTDQEFPVL